LHEEGHVKTSTTGQQGESSQGTKVEVTKEPQSSAEYTYTYESDEGEDHGDEGNDNPEEDTPLLAETLDEYYEKRVFVFVHHYAGAVDPLTTAMRNEALKQGIRLKAISVEKENGSGDLPADEPYNTHLRWARRGYIDAYHAGFPCATFSRLRFRRREGMPGPVRTKSEPHGRYSNRPAAQAECDRGTIMACRAIDMATTVAESRRISTIGAIATLENPPPSNEPEHLSAWELPEMQKFLKVRPSQSVIFNTCRYEENLELGKRHYKPQQFEGTLRGMQCLSLECTCGEPSNHEAIIGPEKSKASATYPEALCLAYAKLAIDHLKLMGKEEFLRSRMASLQNVLDVTKARIVKRDDEFGPDAKPPGQRERPARKTSRSRSRTRTKFPSLSPPTRREYKAATLGDNTRSPARPPLKRRRRDTTTPVKLKPARDVGETPEAYWQGGEGKHETLKPSSAKDANPALLEFIGGMRDPYKVVLPRATLLSLGLRIRAAWEAFERKHKGTSTVAETYGTPDCDMNDTLVKEWKATLKKVLGAKAPPSVKMKPRWNYMSPLDPELLEAWISKSADPDDIIPDWVRNGAPLGIEVPIQTRGIFPLNVDDNNLDYHGQHELEDAGAQMSHGDIPNYASVLDHAEDAKIELDRYRKEGFLVDVDKETVSKEMAHGTISKLGLIIKQKPEGVKRRIILDLRRSGGNKKAKLPEKLVLPRPKDAINMFRNVFEQRRPCGADEGYSRELVVVDISDAFMSLAVHEAELPHALAPEVNGPNFYLFVALLFGFKTAPLLWSRIAALISRLLQSLVQGKEAQHQTYLDDGLWILQGTLVERNSVLSMILTTLFALGLKVSLKKGLRSTQVQWVGVRFTLTEDSIILSLPDKLLEELIQTLQSWDKAGMAPIKELRQVAGRASWVSGILPRTRWVVAVLYRVLHERLNDIASGKESERRQNRPDQRSKDGLCVVKQLEQPRVWLIKYLEVARTKPTRRLKLDTTKYPKATIVTDASPLGAGAILLINNRLVRAYTTKVTHRDARLLGFEDVWEQSSSQGIVETLAVLLALQHWKRDLQSCNVELQVQSDSLVALATSKRLSSATSTLNFLGAEIALTCEEIGIETLRTSHIPGSANKAADWLSRPDKVSKEEVPDELRDIPVHSDKQVRGPEFYHLAPPQLAPDLWKPSSAANSAWSCIN
jgi:hypothetical protein